VGHARPDSFFVAAQFDRASQLSLASGDSIIAAAGREGEPSLFRTSPDRSKELFDVIG
jgi:hypothetical protein